MATDRDGKRPHPKLRGASAPEHEWDRQVDESGPAYAAFLIYRDLGAERSLAKVGQKIGKMRLISKWSSRNFWVARAAAWDRHELRAADDVRREERHRRIREMEERHVAIAVAFQARIVETLQAAPRTLSNSDIATWFAVAVKIERLALGVNTESIQQIDTTRDDVERERRTTALIINDPESSRLAHELLGRIADADAASGISGPLDAPTTWGLPS